MGWWKRTKEWVAGAPQERFTFVDTFSAVDLQIPSLGDRIAGDECYIELYLESVRLEKARRFATTFNGVVYSFLDLAREGEENIELAAVSRPNKLADLDDSNLGRVITISREMTGPIAYRGGKVGLEIALVSVKNENLLKGTLDYILDVSSVAGASYLTAIKPFVPLIDKGMDLISGQSRDVAIEVGYASDRKPDRAFVAAMIEAPADTYAEGAFSIDREGRLLNQGREVGHSHAVFSVRGTKKKHDYGEIPELKSAFAEFRKGLRTRKYTVAEEALAAFKVAVYTSVDLISSDQDELVAKAQARFDRIFPEGGSAGPTESVHALQRGTAESDEDSLYSLQLYEGR